MGQALTLDTFGYLFLYLTAAFGAFLAALWLSLIFWTHRDSRSRSQDRLLNILAALVVAVLGPIGLIIYLILRPTSTLAEAYQHTLESEALLSHIEENPLCPGCSARSHLDWQICPQCHTKLKKRCLHCSHLLELPWNVCPYCSTPAGHTLSRVQIKGS